jgi:ArsR family transcriptional regulator
LSSRSSLEGVADRQATSAAGAPAGRQLYVSGFICWPLGVCTAKEIAARFDMTKPSLSKHLKILEAAGLVASDKRGQFVYYRLQRDTLAHTLSGFMQAVCPVSQKLKKESRALAARKTSA